MHLAALLSRNVTEAVEESHRDMYWTTIIKYLLNNDKYSTESNKILMAF